jgi:hypothetical protein
VKKKLDIPKIKIALSTTNSHQKDVIVLIAA